VIALGQLLDAVFVGHVQLPPNLERFAHG